MVSGNIRTSARVAALSISSAVTRPQSEEIRIRSCAMAGPINPSAMTTARQTRFGMRQPPPFGQRLGFPSRSPSVRGETAVDRQADTDHEARAGAAQPQHRRGDLLGSAEAANRLLFHDLGYRVRLAFEHVGDHRGVDRAGADRVDADAARRVLDTCALGHADHGVLGPVIGCALRKADETTQRRAVDDGAAPLLAHYAQLVLHAGPNAPLIDRSDALEMLDRLVGGIRRRTWMPALLNAMSSRPYSAATRSTIAATSASLATSQATPIAVPPSMTIRSASFAARLPSRSASTTEAPVSANMRAVASPMPLAAPV